MKKKVSLKQTSMQNTSQEKFAAEEPELKQKNETYERRRRECSASAEIKEKRRKYYQENKYRICNRVLNCYCLKAIEQIRASCPGKVGSYMRQYPFEEYAEVFIRRALCRYNIYRTHGMYDDCYDAGMLAYLYSIHRCAAAQYTHTQAYIKKMIRIYIICAMVVYQESKNICRVNGLRETCLDAEYFNDLY